MSEKFYDKFTEKKSGKGDKKRSGNKPENKSAKASSDEKNVKTSVRTNSEKQKGSFAKNTDNRNGDNHQKDFSGARASSGRPNDKNRKNSFKKDASSKDSAQYSVLNSLFSVKKLSEDSQYVLENFDEIVQGVRPLNSRQIQQLPDNIRDLSHQLTDDRASRRLGYMNENVQLSAYVRYYTWWNLVRLTRLFSNLPDSSFPSVSSSSKAENSEDKEAPIICLDLGSGPLTVVTALWLARPELRSRKIQWYCLDVSANSMALGEDVYLSVVARSGEEPWKITRVKGSFGTSLKQKADFITCANMFNELDQASDMPPEYSTKKYFDQLQVYANKDAKFLLIEPGVPKASRTVSLLRDRFIRAGKTIIAPCPHAGDCPMNGFKAYTGSQNKWCNFAFSTENAPSKLQKLSERSKLPKERATLCFVSVGNNSESASDENSDDLLCRIASDPFRMPGNRTGYYCCSKLGLSLVTVNKRFNAENPSENNMLSSGDLVQVKIKTPELQSLAKDEKSGAVKIDL